MYRLRSAALLALHRAGVQQSQPYSAPRSAVLKLWLHPPPAGLAAPTYQVSHKLSPPDASVDRSCRQTPRLPRSPAPPPATSDKSRAPHWEDRLHPAILSYQTSAQLF